MAPDILVKIGSDEVLSKFLHQAITWINADIGRKFGEIFIKIQLECAVTHSKSIYRIHNQAYHLYQNQSVTLIFDSG